MGILVVDDDFNTTEIIAHGLKEQGYTNVRIASDGVTCLSVLQAEGHDIYAIVLDYKMPRFSGLDVIRHLVNVHPHVVGVVMVTGFGTEEIKAEFEKIGSDNILAIDLLSKPFAFPTLFDDVERTLKLVTRKRRDRGLVHLSEVASRLSSLDERFAVLDKKLQTLEQVPKLATRVEELCARTPGFLGQLGFEVVKTVVIAALVLAVIYIGVGDWLVSIIRRVR